MKDRHLSGLTVRNQLFKKNGASIGATNYKLPTMKNSTIPGTWEPNQPYVFGSIVNYLQERRYPFSTIAEIIHVDVRGKNYAITVAHDSWLNKPKIYCQQDDTHYTPAGYEELFKIIENN